MHIWVEKSDDKGLSVFTPNSTFQHNLKIATLGKYDFLHAEETLGGYIILLHYIN